MSDQKMSVDALLVAAEFLEWSNHSDSKARGASAHGGDDSPPDDVSLHAYVKQASSPLHVKQSDSPKIEGVDVKKESTDEEAASAKAYWRRPGGAGSRETHKKLEKNRRAHLKECFENLRQQIPNIGDRKTSNLTILRQSLRWINLQRKKEKELDDELERLAHNRLMLQLKLSSLEQELRDMQVNVAPFLCADEDTRSVSTATADNSPIVSENEEEDDRTVKLPLPVSQHTSALPDKVPFKVTPTVDIRSMADKPRSQVVVQDVTTDKPRPDLSSLAVRPSHPVVAGTVPTGQTILRLPTGQTLITMPAAQAIVTIATTIATSQVPSNIMTTVSISQAMATTMATTSVTVVTTTTTSQSAVTNHCAPTKPQVARMLQQAITERQNRQHKLLQQQLKTLSEMTVVKTQAPSTSVLTQPQLLAVSAVASPVVATSKPVTPLRPTVSLSHLLPSVIPAASLVATPTSQQPVLRLGALKPGPTLLSCLPVATSAMTIAPQPVVSTTPVSLASIKLTSAPLPRAQIISPAQLSVLQQALNQSVSRSPLTTATTALTMTPILSVGQGQVLPSQRAQVMSPMILTPTTMQLTSPMTPTTLQLSSPLTPTTMQLTAPHTPLLKTQVGSFPLVTPYTLPIKPVVVVSVPGVVAGATAAPLSTSGQSTVVTLGNGL